MKFNGKTYTKTEIPKRIGDLSQIGGIRQFTLNDGQASGTRAIEVNTGAGLKFTILPDRGMDVAWAECKGVPLCWISENGIKGNQFYENRGTEFLRYFNGGLIKTCGLRSLGGIGFCCGSAGKGEILRHHIAGFSLITNPEPASRGGIHSYDGTGGNGQNR